jgi:hypothetical protein
MLVLRRKNAMERRRRMLPPDLPRNQNRRRRKPSTRVQKLGRRALRRRRRTVKSHSPKPTQSSPPQSSSFPQPRNGIPSSLRFPLPQISPRPLQHKHLRSLQKRRRCTPSMSRITPLLGSLRVPLPTASSCKSLAIWNVIRSAECYDPAGSRKPCA